MRRGSLLDGMWREREGGRERWQHPGQGVVEYRTEDGYWGKKGSCLRMIEFCGQKRTMGVSLGRVVLRYFGGW